MLYGHTGDMANDSPTDGYTTNVPTKSHIENCFLSLNPKVEALPQQAEWAPFPLPKDDEKIDFVDGLHTLGGSGDPNLREGVALYVYMINADMDHRAFCNTDGDFLLVAQLGNLDIQTELGKIFLQPGEICVIQRGIRFAVRLGPGHKVARGYITEVWGSMWELPDLGPIGGHGLANPRDFLYPVAYIDDELHEDWIIVNKANGKYNAIQQDHSPFDVAAWHGNVVPYKVRIICSRFPRTYRALADIPPAVRSDQVCVAKRDVSRPHRPVDQLRADRQVAGPQHAPGGLPVVRAALGRCVQHLPAAVLPPQLGDRVPGVPVRQRAGPVGRLPTRRRQRRGQPHAARQLQRCLCVRDADPGERASEDPGA